MASLTPTDEERRRHLYFRRRVEWIFLAFFLFLALTIYINFLRVAVHGRSMEPTLHDGDTLSVWKTVPREKLLAGDIIVFRDEEGFELIKRIVFLQNVQGTALPPDFVRVPGGTRPFKTLFHYYNTAVASGLLAHPSPENTIYVMGDNTDNSEDSRVFGPIRPDHIIGKVIFKDISLR